MAYTPRHGLNAGIFLDTSTAGTFTAGTVNLEQITGKNTWTFDQSVDFVDTTSFGATSKTQVAGLPGASGDISGNWDAVGTLVYNLINATAERAIMIFPDYTNNKTSYISGKAFFSVKSGGGITEAVSLDLHFEAGPTGMTWTHP